MGSQIFFGPFFDFKMMNGVPLNPPKNLDEDDHEKPKMIIVFLILAPTIFWAWTNNRPFLRTPLLLLEEATSWGF
jgi:hypothetical protein